jgi:hypothetical protein
MGMGNPNALSRGSSQTSRSSDKGRETGVQQERRPQRRTGTWRQLEFGSTAAHEKSTGASRAALAAKPRGRNTQIGSALGNASDSAERPKKMDRHSARNEDQRWPQIGSALVTQLEKQLRKKLAEEETCSHARTDGAHELET